MIFFPEGNFNMQFFVLQGLAHQEDLEVTDTPRRKATQPDILSDLPLQDRYDF